MNHSLLTTIEGMVNQYDLFVKPVNGNCGIGVTYVPKGKINIVIDNTNDYNEGGFLKKELKAFILYKDLMKVLSIQSAL